MTWTPWEKLTDRERQVLIAAGKGLEGHEVAQLLGIDKVTVRRHFQRAREKLGAHSVPHALVVAMMRGEISLHDMKVTAPTVAEKAGAA